MIMRPAGKPRLDLGSFVGGIVIHDDMDIEPFWDSSVDLFEEVQELGRPVTLVTFADDESDIECGEQRSRTVPHVAVRATFGYTRHHRQDRLLAIECLDLALLIDAEDDGAVGRRYGVPVDKQSVVDSLNVWLRCGCKPTPPTSAVSWCGKSQFSAAIERIDQCVASTGAVRNVRSITAAT